MTNRERALQIASDAADYLDEAGRLEATGAEEIALRLKIATVLALADISEGLEEVHLELDAILEVLSAG